jgi:hypothetical protein
VLDLFFSLRLFEADALDLEEVVGVRLLFLFEEDVFVIRNIFAENFQKSFSPYLPYRNQACCDM